MGQIEQAAMDSPGCHQLGTINASPTLSDAASASRLSGKQEKHFSATRYEHIVGPQLVFPHIQRPDAAGHQLCGILRRADTHLLLIHTHMPLSAMISGRLDWLRLPAKCPQPRREAGSTHTGGGKSSGGISFKARPNFRKSTVDTSKMQMNESLRKMLRFSWQTVSDMSDGLLESIRF